MGYTEHAVATARQQRLREGSGVYVVINLRSKCHRRSAQKSEYTTLERKGSKTAAKRPEISHRISHCSSYTLTRRHVQGKPVTFLGHLSSSEVLTRLSSSCFVTSVRPPFSLTRECLWRHTAFSN